MTRNSAVIATLSALIRHYPPRPSTDSAIRALCDLKAEDKAVRFLVDKLKHRHWRVRAAAAAALESFPNFRAAPALVAASKDRNVDVSIMAIHSLWAWSLGSPKLKKSVFDVCRHAVTHSSHGVRGAAFECLSHMADAQSDALIMLADKDRHPQIRQQSAWWHQERRRSRGGA